MPEDVVVRPAHDRPVRQEPRRRPTTSLHAPVHAGVPERGRSAAKSHGLIFGEETHVNYNRILLSSVPAGERATEEITLNDWDWYKRNKIDLRAGVRIVSIDAAAGTGPCSLCMALGAVAGIVGAGGNAGAVAAGFPFKSESLSWPQALFILGGIVTLCSAFAFGVRFSRAG